MSVYFSKKGEKGRFRFFEAKCLGASCFAPGNYQHRGATGSGSRNTGNSTLCCLNNAYHGCPEDTEHSEEAEKRRKSEGWKKT